MKPKKLKLTIDCYFCKITNLKEILNYFFNFAAKRIYSYAIHDYKITFHTVVETVALEAGRR